MTRKKKLSPWIFQIRNERFLLNDLLIGWFGIADQFTDLLHDFRSFGPLEIGGWMYLISNHHGFWTPSSPQSNNPLTQASRSAAGSHQKMSIKTKSSPLRWNSPPLPPHWTEIAKICLGIVGGLRVHATKETVLRFVFCLLRELTFRFSNKCKKWNNLWD